MIFIKGMQAMKTQKIESGYCSKFVKGMNLINNINAGSLFETEFANTNLCVSVTITANENNPFQFVSHIICQTDFDLDFADQQCC